MKNNITDLKIGRCNFKQINISSGLSENRSSINAIVQRLFNKGETKLVFKLDSLLGTSMFRLFHEAASRAADSKGKIFIIATNEAAREMLTLFGVNRIIEIFESEKELEAYCKKIKKFEQKRGTIQEEDLRVE